MKKTGFTFKPLFSHDFKNVSEKEVAKTLNKEQIETLKKNKTYSVEKGTFKAE
jgi:hypothetical protein